jgi:hypothetical protein
MFLFQPSLPAIQNHCNVHTALHDAHNKKPARGSTEAQPNTNRRLAGTQGTLLMLEHKPPHIAVLNAVFERKIGK